MKPLIVMILGLTLAAGSGYLASTAFSQESGPTRTVTVDVATGPAGPAGPPGPKGDPGPAGERGGAAPRATRAATSSSTHQGAR